MHAPGPRTEARITCQGTTCHLSTERNNTIVAQALNVSPSGIFVNAPHLYDVGTELTCDLALPTDRLTLRGRVAWVSGGQSGEGRGMGIEFVDLSASAANSIQRLIDGWPSSDMRATEGPVANVWFEGMAEPVRAAAVTHGRAIKLRTWLPFLRLQSPVRIAFSEGAEGCAPGVLREVKLTAHPDHPIPCLEALVDYADASDEWQRSGGGWEAIPEEPVLLEVADPKTKRADPDPEPDALPCEQLSLKLSAEQGEEQQAVTDVNLTEQLLNPETSPDLSPGPSIDEQEPLSALSSSDEDEASAHWSFEELAPDLLASEQSAFWGAQATDRRRLAWLWLGALAMAAIAIASTLHTGLWTRLGAGLFGGSASSVEGRAGGAPAALSAPQIGEAAKLSPVDAVQLTAQEAAEAQHDEEIVIRIAPDSPQSASEAKPSSPDKTGKPVAKAPTPSEERPQAEPLKPQEGRPRVQPAPVARRPTERPQRGVAPRVRVEPSGRASLTIPLSGSTEGAVHYPLARPDGLVVKLPRAQPKVPFRDYALHLGGFRVLWVRPQEEGVQLRFLFGQPTPRHKLQIASDRITVTLEPEGA